MVSFLSKAQEWYARRPERSLDLAYEAVLRIHKLEEEYFDSGTVNPEAGYGEATYTVLRTQLRNNLYTIRLRLLEYQLFTIVPSNSSQNVLSEGSLLTEYEDQIPAIVEKLAAIDEYLARYQEQSNLIRLPPIVQIVTAQITETDPRNIYINAKVQNTIINKSRQAYSERNFIPNSILVTLQRFKDILSLSSQKFEEELVDEVQRIRRRTVYTFAFLGFLLFTILTVQFVAKNLIYGPIIDTLNPPEQLEIKFSKAAQEHALKELRKARDNIEFERLVAQLSGKPIDQEEQETRLRMQAKNILLSYNRESLEGTKNLLTDITTLFVVYAVVILGRNQIGIIRGFITETLQGMSDIAKAFLLIFATDTFVGYHSSDGWDALLTVLFHRFGIPENQVLNRSFIATVPVLLDALFKFWIFQYLRRTSPATATIYREMNE